MLGVDAALAAALHPAHPGCGMVSVASSASARISSSQGRQVAADRPTPVCAASPGRPRPISNSSPVYSHRSSRPSARVALLGAVAEADDPVRGCAPGDR